MLDDLELETLAVRLGAAARGMELLGKPAFGRQSVADPQLVGADMVFDRVDRSADERLARTWHEIGHAATPLFLSSLGLSPKWRPKARLKLALLE